MENLDVEEVLVYLQLCKNINLVLLDGWQEITNHVCAVTKALSKRPFKLLTERAELPFCVDGAWAGGARVERDGSGLIQVWSRQIQQLNRVSPSVASTVTGAYPSPQLLLQVDSAPLATFILPGRTTNVLSPTSSFCFRRTRAWSRRRTERGCWPASW
uniref:ERCC4 domain-containing protein n=1 Tax=Gasterosteus aculeatus TaxID=69293 RepID=G3P0A7_GASAC